MDDVPVTGSHSTQLARLQQRLWSHAFNFHTQTFLALALGELAARVRPLAFALHRGGHGPVGGGVGGQDDGIRHGSAAVRDVDARVAVVFVPVGGKRAACWDVRDRQGVSEPGDVFVPVST